MLCVYLCVCVCMYVVEDIIHSSTVKRNMYGLAVNVTYGVYKRFWKRRVGMYRIRYILWFHVHSNCKSSFSDHLACMWCDDQSSHNYSVFLKNLKDSPCVAQAICLCTCSKRKFSTLSFQLANESHFRICKDACRYSSIIHRKSFSQYVLCCYLALF